ncbi:MAG TPA: DUF4870 domain-containing protein [Nitrososphaera sp.]
MDSSPTTEERIWAMISHLSALAFGLGIVIPILGWSEQRQKSKYVSFQCLQALGYQSLGYTIWLLIYIVLVILLAIIFMFVAVNAENNSSVVVAGTAVFMLAIFGFLGLYLLLPVIAAIACGFGRNFYYPILGTRLAKYVGFQPSNDDSPSLIEEHEERWAASMGHFSVIIALWGMIAPASTLILQGKHSAFLKFQSMQATIYQGIVNLLFLGAGGVYFLGILMTFVILGLTGNAGIDTPTGIFSLILFFVSLLIAALVVLAIPLFHILGQWAGYRVLKGENYRYPIIGKIVEKRLAKSYGVQEIAPASSGEVLDSIKENP